MKILGMNVEIVNDGILQEDLEFITQKYTKGTSSLQPDGLASLERLGSGSYGTVYGYKDYAIKYLRDEDCKRNKDAEVLKDISHLEFIPTLYAIVDDRLLIVEKITGDTVEGYCNRNRENNFLNIGESFIDKFQKALFEIIKLGYTPNDLHGNNVMVDYKTGMPKIVDVGFFDKHNEDYDFNDDESVKSNYGYKNAISWTVNDCLRYYIRRQDQMKKAV